MVKRPLASKQRKTGIDPGGVLISHGCWCGGDACALYRKLVIQVTPHLIKKSWGEQVRAAKA